MKYLLLLLSFSCCSILMAQDVYEDNRSWRAEQNKEFGDSATTPLTSVGWAAFDSLHFFPIDPAFAIVTYLELTPEAEPFKMPTSTERLADYRQYGTAHFELNGQSFKIPVYQNLRLLKMPKYKKYLFIPFTDLTNGEETYGGGRYVEAEIPEGDSLLIDFNKAYNPYCAYNHKYSCPIPPAENHIEARIEAGVLNYKSKEKGKKRKKSH